MGIHGHSMLKIGITTMNGMTILGIGLTVVLAVTVVLAAMYWRDHRRLAEQERSMKSLRRELDQLLGTRYMDLGSRIKKT